jgi:hypothetical protein
MTARTGNLRSDNKGYPNFIMAAPPSVLEDKRARIAEWLLLIWLKHSDHHILGLRRVDEEKNGRPLAMIHIAIPLEYRRKQLAQMLGISEFEDERKTPRVNLMASARWNKPHSYIRDRADFIVSRVLGTIKERIVRPGEASGHTIQIPLAQVQTLSMPGPDHRDENSRLRSDVERAMAMRNVSIEPGQIQILTHRASGEKWVRIINVDRSRRTILRTAIKRAGINALLERKDEVKCSDWSIRFAAAAISKLLPQSPDSFDVHSDPKTFAGYSGNDGNNGSILGTERTGRQTSLTTTTDSPSPQGNRSQSRMVS